MKNYQKKDFSEKLCIRRLATLFDYQKYRSQILYKPTKNELVLIWRYYIFYSFIWFCPPTVCVLYHIFKKEKFLIKNNLKKNEANSLLTAIHFCFFSFRTNTCHVSTSVFKLWALYNISTFLIKRFFLFIWFFLLIFAECWKFYTSNFLLMLTFKFFQKSWTHSNTNLLYMFWIVNFFLQLL